MELEMKYSINNETGSPALTDEQGLRALQICQGITKLLGDFASSLEVIKIFCREEGGVTVSLVFVEPTLGGKFEKVEIEAGAASSYTETATVGYIVLETVERTLRKLKEHRDITKSVLLPDLESNTQTISEQLGKIQCTHVDDGAGGQREPYHCTNYVANFAGKVPVGDGDTYCTVHVDPTRRSNGK
jgi:hypothetical protein